MKTLICISASCFVSLALNGVLHVQSAPNTKENEDHDYGTACPFPVLVNEVPMAIPVGCSQTCNKGTQELGDGGPCYVIERNVWDRMTPLLWHKCPLGECRHGQCRSVNKTENCRKGNDEDYEEEDSD